MYKNKVFIITIVFALIAAAVFGFLISYTLIQKNSRKNTPKITALNMIGYTYTSLQMTQLINTYERTHPTVTINYTQISPSSYNDYVLQRIHSTVATDIKPDIFESKSQDQNIFLKYSALAPDNIISKDYFQNTYYNIYKRGLLSQSGVLGLPENLSPLILLYNKGLLTASGYSISNFASDFNSFNNNSTLYAKTNPGIASVNIGYPKNIKIAGDILQLFMLENQTEMNSPSTAEADFNNTQGIESLQYYASFIKGVHKDNWSISNEEDTAIFAKGNALMIFAYPQEIALIKEINPSINLGYSIYPSLVSPVDLAKYDYLEAYKNSPNSYEAWNFIKYLNEKPSLQIISNFFSPSNGYGIVSPRKDIALPSSNSSEIQNVLNQAAPISIDWNNEGESDTQTAFNRILTNGLSGNFQGALDSGVKEINTNIQNASAM